MTQRDSYIVRNYEQSTAYSLYSVYGTFSQAKANAWEYCRRLCADLNGRGLKVIGANGFQFTAGFKYEKDGVEYLMYITKTADRPIKLA